MQPKTNKITIIKPSWPTGSWSTTIESWKKMCSVVQTEFGSSYSINHFPVSHGLSGVKTTQKHILSNVNHRDLFIAYHLNSNYPKTIDYKPAYYESLWYFDNNGYGGFGDIAKKDLLLNVDNTIDYDSFYTSRIEHLARHTKYNLDNRKSVESNIPSSDFLFVALQVENDSVMSLKSIDSYEMIQRVYEASKELDLPVVVKFHPKGPNRHKIQLKIKEMTTHNPSKKGLYISDGDVKELLNRCKAVFVINSGVGFEGLIRLKPVYTFGKSDYTQAAYHNYTTPEIISSINAVHDKNKLKQFLYYWWQEIIDFNHDSYYDKIKSKVLDKLNEQS